MFGKHRQLDKTYPPLITKMNFLHYCSIDHPQNKTRQTKMLHKTEGNNYVFSPSSKKSVLKYHQVSLTKIIEN